MRSFSHDTRLNFMGNFTHFYEANLRALHNPCQMVAWISLLLPLQYTLHVAKVVSLLLCYLCVLSQVSVIPPPPSSSSSSSISMLKCDPFDLDATPSPTITLVSFPDKLIMRLWPSYPWQQINACHHADEAVSPAICHQTTCYRSTH